MTRPLRLAVRWMAPETAGPGPLHFSEATDVYAFGVFVWEVLSGGAVPFRHWDAATARAKIREGARPINPAGGDPSLYALLTNQCWCRDPATRTPFSGANWLWSCVC